MRLEEKREDLGAATISPNDDIVVNEPGSWDITYTVGAQRIEPDGGMRVVIPYGFTPPQTAYGVGIGYTTASASRAGVTPTVYSRDPKARGSNQSMWGFNLYVIIEEGALEPGDTLTLHYGDTRVGCSNAGAFAQYFEGEAEFMVAVDPDGTRTPPEGGFYLIADPPPAIRVLSREATQLSVVVPSIVLCGATASVKVSARDDEHNAVYELDEELALTNPDGEQVAGRFGERSHCTFGEVKFGQEGTVRIPVADKDGAVRGQSNPCLCLENPPDRRLFWGDIHVMTGLTAGMSRPAQAFEYARDLTHLDFCACTDGDSGGLASYFSDEEWEETVAAVRAFHEPGRFVTLLGSEYHERRVAGDKNIYYRDDSAGLLRWCDLAEDQPHSLWRALEGRKALTVPHHTVPTGGGRLRPWNFHHPEYQRLVEVYSCWGSSESVGCPRAAFWGGPEENSVQSGLAKGYRMGIIASGDSHDGHPGNCDWLRIRRGYPSGLVAVYAPELTREAVFDALWDRCCYGTSGKRICLSFALNGAHMGEELSRAEDRAARSIRVEAAGTAPIAEIHVIRNSEVAYVHTGSGLDEQFEWVDNADFTAAALSGYDGRPFLYYYVRVVQEDGELAWSSPIWVS